MSKLSAPFRHVQTPIEIFDYWLPILGHVELKILMIIVRQTFGWHKTKDRISISQLVEKSGSNRTRACEAIESLISHNLIKKEIEGVLGQEKTYYELIFEDKEIPTSTKTVPPGYQNGTPPSTKLVPTKETLTKETLTKDNPIQSNPLSPFLKPIQQPTLDELDESNKSIRMQNAKEKLKFLAEQFEDSEGKFHSFDQSTKEVLFRKHDLQTIQNAHSYMVQYYEDGNVPKNPLGLFRQAINENRCGRSPDEDLCVKWFLETQNRLDLHHLQLIETCITDVNSSKDMVFKGFTLQQFKEKLHEIFIKPLHAPEWNGLSELQDMVK
jgi:phage replication O-like protein O